MEELLPEQGERITLFVVGPRTVEGIFDFMQDGIIVLREVYRRGVSESIAWYTNVDHVTGWVQGSLR